MFKSKDEADNIKGKDSEKKEKPTKKGKKKSGNPFANVVKGAK